MRQVQNIIPRFVYVRHSNESIQDVFAWYVQQIVIDFSENVCSSISSVIDTHCIHELLYTALKKSISTENKTVVSHILK